MNLYEFEGKRLLRQYGIPVPESELLCAPTDTVRMTAPYVLKCQVLTGGRGKAGGVRVCESADALPALAASLFALHIKGHATRALLCESLQTVRQELYVAITLEGVDTPTLILCASGGMDIEQVARTAPEKLLRLPIDPFTGLKDYQLGYAVAHAGVADKAALIDLLRNLEKAFFGLQARLTEINPLGVLQDGSIVAMDAKVVLDDAARETRPLMAELAQERLALRDYVAPEEEKTTITYVPLGEGDIGLISDGAGTGMLALDLLTDRGGKVGSFCELGGTTPAEVMYRAMHLTLDGREQIRAVAIVLIGGFNRMDDMANGITGYFRDHPGKKVPVFTRMCGTMEAEGKAIMAEAGIPVYDDLSRAIDGAILATKGAD